MDFANALTNKEEGLQDEYFFYDEEGSVEKCDLFKHNVYKGNKILSMDKEISSLEKFNKEVITLDVIPSLRVIDELDMEMVVEAENTTVSPVMKESSKFYVCPVCNMPHWSLASPFFTEFQSFLSKYKKYSFGPVNYFYADDTN